MKKRLIALVLCAAALLLLLPVTQSAAYDAVSLISVGDLLPAELVNAAVYYNGATYVPYWLFTNYGLGLSYRTVTGSTAVCLSNGTLRLFFDTSTGKTYDEDNYQYSASAIIRGGTVYLPLGFVCSFFRAFSYAYIGGSEYATILRIHTGRELLTDEEFLQLAGPAMKRYYDSYYRAQETPAPGGETAAPTPSPTPDPDHAGDTVLLGLEGIPGDAVLSQLRRQGMDACIFLRPEELREQPDRVRRLACEGFVLGLVCPEGAAEEFAALSRLLWETARVRSVMLLLPTEVPVPEGAAGFYRSVAAPADGNAYSVEYAAETRLEFAAGETVFVYPDGGDPAVLLRYLQEQRFAVSALRETDTSF